MVKDNFQNKVEMWIEKCFSKEELGNKIGRTHRFLEESLELSQASGCTKDEALALVEYVYGRPDGEVEKEVGGVMITLSGLCSSFEIDMDRAAEEELSRNWDRFEMIRNKYINRPVESPLPE